MAFESLWLGLSLGLGRDYMCGLLVLGTLFLGLV